MQRFCIVCLMLVIPFSLGCSRVFQKLFAEQTWSENYARTSGVECTSPEMVDGNIHTTGETFFPGDFSGTTAYGSVGPSSEATVRLPQRKSIHKIVIHNENLVAFDVQAATDKEGGWKVLREVKSNDQRKIVLRVSAVTDAIRIRVKRTSDDKAGQRTRFSVMHGLGDRLIKSPAKIQEIELYGFTEE